MPKERYISSEKNQQIIVELRLAWYNSGISKNNEFARQYTKSVI